MPLSIRDLLHFYGFDDCGNRVLKGPCKSAARGARVPSGIYYARLQSQGRAAIVQRLVLLK
jgi:hypothetical protein